MQDNVSTLEAPTTPSNASQGGEHANDRSPERRAHYAALVDKYFDYAHHNRLEELMAMFTDDAFGTFVVNPNQTYSGKEALRGFYAQLFKDYPQIEPEIFAVIIEGNRAITEQKITIVSPDGSRIVFPFNTNHFTFEGDLIKTLRVMGSPA